MSWAIMLSVAGLVLLAFFLRAYFNVGPATLDGQGFVLSESDAYYHHHAAEYAQANNWQTLRSDPLSAYPDGGNNDNPPLWEWSIALFGAWLKPILGSPASPQCGIGALTPADLCTSTWWVTVTSPAVWGALTIVPTFLIARELWGNKAGLIAAFLLATMTGHIERSVLGFADHDAFALFFIVLCFYFFIRALRTAHDGDWVLKWGRSGSVVDGLSAYYQANERSIGYALLAGVSIGAVSLVWKGFPYAVAMIAGYAGLQMLVNHWRGRDSTAVFFTAFFALLPGMFIGLPYYFSAGFGILATVHAPFYIFLALIGIGLVFVPTRDFPTVLVFPAFILLAALGVVGAFFVVPEVVYSLLGPLIYFKQSKLYTTIAEAHPGDFNQVVFGTGVLVFFFTMIGFVLMANQVRKTWNKEMLFVLIWGVVAYYMVTAAVRFLFNATPAFAIIGGWFVAQMIDFLKFEDIRKTMAGFKGDLVGGLRRSVRASQVVGTLLITAFLVLPNVWLAVDAAMPGQYEDQLQKGILNGDLRARGVGFSDEELKSKSIQELRIVYMKDELRKRGFTDEQLGARPTLDALVGEYTKHELAARNLDDTAENRQAVAPKIPGDFIDSRLRTFGQGFIPDYWRELYVWLSQRDLDKAPVDRPAFLSWWDYGHWAISIGNHPAVADNFQSNFEFAGHFIAAQNETHAVQLLAAKQASLVEAREPLLTKAQVVADLKAVGVSDKAAADVDCSDPAVMETNQENVFCRWVGFKRYQKNATGGIVTDAAGNNVVENVRPFGFVSEAELDLERSVTLLSLFEAKTGKHIRYFAVDVRLFPYDNPQTPSIDQTSIFYAPLTLSDHNPDDYVEAVGLGPRDAFHPDGEYTTEEINAIRRDITRAQDFQLSGFKYKYKEPFFGSMFYKAYIGTPPSPAPTPEKPVDGSSLPGLIYPGFGLKHFRLVFANSGVRMLQYYPGAIGEGAVTVNGGRALPDTAVSVADDAGTLTYALLGGDSRDRITVRDLNVFHDRSQSDAQGRFRVIMPFATTDAGVEMRLSRGSVILGRFNVSVSVEEAERSVTIDPARLVFDFANGSLAGFVFYDRDKNGVYDVGTDDPLTNYSMSVGGVAPNVTDDGAYWYDDMLPGTAQISIFHSAYIAVGEQSADVEPGKHAVHNVSMDLRSVTFIGNLTTPDGTKVGDSTIQFALDANATRNTAENQTTIVQTDGSYQTSVKPGTYVVTAKKTLEDGRRFELRETLVVAPGEVGPNGGAVVHDFVMTQSFESTPP
ncbi:MAG: glycosyltransferase family 39 protein [Euryarchaeota archaeon]|nr:glycosyltransferase family 39 protein [Euryarchaeota archaeon]